MALTKLDLQLIRKIVREEVRKEVKKEISTEVLPFKNEMYEFKNDIKNDILQFKDDILHEIIGLREDMAILTGYRGQLENHENRLEVVENHLGIPQS